jgi:tetratricopeptide (TPR) repeat protein
MGSGLVAMVWFGWGCATIPVIPAPEPNTSTSTPVQAQANYLKGQLLVAKGDLEGGRTALLRARIFDPNAAPIIMALGRVALTEGDIGQARALFAEAAATAADDPEAWLATGRLEIAFGDADTGRSALRKAVEWGDPWKARAALIAEALHHGRPPEGLDVWVALKTTDSIELRRRGDLRLLAGDGPGAVDDYLSALEHSGRDFSVVSPLIQAATTGSRVAHALTGVEGIIERQPSATAAMVCAGLLNELVGDSAETIRHLEWAIELGAKLGSGPTATLARARGLPGGVKAARPSSGPEKAPADDVNQAVTLVEAQRFDEGERVVALGLQSDPDDPRLMYILSEIYLKRDGIEAAEPQVERVLASHPNFVPALNLWAWIHAVKGEDLALAEARIRQALHHQVGVGAYWDTLGWVLHQQGRHLEARRALLRALRLSPEDDTVLDHLDQCRGTEEMGRP